MDITSAVEYLHSMEIIHCDLKTSNILLDKKFRAKLCDFGLVLKRGEVRSYLPGEDIEGSIRYLSPELLDTTKFRQWKKSADVFGYGVILWEIASQDKPWEPLNSNAVIPKVLKGERNAIPQDCPNPYAELIERSWIQDESQRGDMKAARKWLEDHSKEILAYKP